MPRVLIIAHSYYNRAGVEEHLRTLARMLSSDHDIHFIFPHQDAIVHMYQQQEVARYSSPALSIVAPFRHAPAEQALQAVIATVRPEVIHIAHFVGWPLSIFALIAENKIPHLISFHDYFAITPIYTLEGQKAQETLTPEYALKYFDRDISDYLRSRRELLIQSLAAIKTQIVPSHYLAAELGKIFPRSYQIIPYGIEDRILLPLSPASRLRFGYVGSLLPQKGWDLLLEAFQSLAGRYAECELHFFGGARPPHLPAHERVFFHGVYEQSHISQLCTQFDIGVIPSRFPETFSIVLSELWQAQKPVLVANLGALAERVKDLSNGRTFLPGNAPDLASKLEWFLHSDEWKTWPVETPPGAKEMAERYAGIYAQIISDATD